jgi:DNA-binding beta-propeller fold protein YncE
LHRISIFDQDGQFLSKWGVQGQGEGEFNRPAGLAFDADGHLLVADGLNHRIQRYTSDGQFLGQWGRHGKGAGEFDLPWGLAVDAENQVYVADWRNDRIQKFDAQGTPMAAWGQTGSGEGEFQRPAAVAVDEEGLMYVADWGNERVQIFDPHSGFLALLRGDSGVSKWGQDYFMSNQDELEERQHADLEPELNLLPSDGPREVSASIEKLFWGPTSVKIDAEGRLYVVDSCRHRIQVYRKTTS